MNAASVLIVSSLAYLAPLATQISDDNPKSVLAQYEGDWLINNGYKKTTRRVSKNGLVIASYTSMPPGCFGGPGHRSMRIWYDKSTQEYRARIRWSAGSLENHFNTEWAYDNLRGIWNAKTKTMTWTPNENLAKKRFMVEHCFVCPLQQTTKIEIGTRISVDERLHRIH